MAYIHVLYEDNHLLVVEKPQNMLSQADNTGDPDILAELKAYIKEKYNKPGEVYLGLVHRLDRPVGGAMVFARTSKAASRLSEQIRTGEFGKTYLAVVTGSFQQKTGRLENFLLKDEKTNIVSVVTANTRGAKSALLDYEVLETSGEFSLVRIKLHTGRSHQIRVQFAASGHPLYGDRKYGEEDLKGSTNIALWSVEIVCAHPTTKAVLHFSSNPPGIYPWNLFKTL
jgi:23S rRNA pseudouridine1911/1915/1917 synthase